MSLLSKVVRDGANYDADYDCQCENSYNITNLPGDCLNLIFERLGSKAGRNSFGLTCRQWLHIQNNNFKSLTYLNHHRKDGRFLVILCKLLIRFQRLKTFRLACDIPLNEMTDFATLKPPSFFESKVQCLCLDNWTSDIELSLVFSWFPRLIDICLTSDHVTDNGLEALVKCCISLKRVALWGCNSITDSGISFLLQNCAELSSLYMRYCRKITGIGFLDCPKTLTHLEARGSNLKPEGIKAMVSGGGLEYLEVSSHFELTDIGKGFVNTEAVLTISNGCPLLKKLFLCHCEEVELEGWEALGQNCKNLERLSVTGSIKLCDIGLQALCNGCNKLSSLLLDDKSSCSSSAIELFKLKKPQCHIFLY